MNQVYFAESLDVLDGIPTGSVNLIYIDPPFNTGRVQRRFNKRLKEWEDYQYEDSFEDYLAFLEPRLIEARRVLNKRGTLYFHSDPKEVHYCKVLLDQIFGRFRFLNEVIWSYDYGGRSKHRWPAKHDNILVYTKGYQYTFNYHDLDRIPYQSTRGSPEKLARGKTPTDVWWHTIVPTNSFEKTGYPTQKPEGIIRRIITASSNPGDTVLDFFAGSGTTGAVAEQLGRRFILVDNNADAIEVMRNRLTGEVEWL